MPVDKIILLLLQDRERKKEDIPVDKLQTKTEVQDQFNYTDAELPF